MSDENRQLIVFPHIKVSGWTDLGKWRLVSSSDLEHFPKKYHPHVKSFASMYRTINHDINEVGVLVRKSGSRLGVLSDAERNQVENLVNALIFSSCYSSNRSDLARDNFRFTIWNFVGSKGPTDIVNLPSRRFRMQIVENRPHLIQIPSHVFWQTFSERNYNKDLLSALHACNSTEKTSDHQLMHSLYWFNLAHADTEDVTEYTRFTMTSAAFEALLDTPRHGVTEYFKRSVQLLLGKSAELESWAEAFYRARSNVVHGNELPDLMYGKHKHQSLLVLADIIFTQCVYRILSLRLHWPSNETEHLLRLNVKKFLISNKERFETLKHFTLNQKRKKTDEVFNVLYQIQKYDQSVDLQDCDDAFKKVLYLASDGLNRLSKSKEMQTPVRKAIIRAYREAYNSIKNQVQRKKSTNIYQTLRSVEKVKGGDLWDDATVRGQSFGEAKLISLDSLHAAMYDIENLRTERLYR